MTMWQPWSTRESSPESAAPLDSTELYSESQLIVQLPDLQLYCFDSLSPLP